MSVLKNVLRMTGVGGIFAAGYLCGAVLQPAPAEAQVGELMKQAAGSGGALGTAARLGTTITEMQKNVDSLNENLKVLGEIKKALGG
jgi:H+/gluconate symporter-like permease